MEEDKIEPIDITNWSEHGIMEGKNGIRIFHSNYPEYKWLDNIKMILAKTTKDENIMMYVVKESRTTSLFYAFLQNTNITRRVLETIEKEAHIAFDDIRHLAFSSTDKEVLNYIIDNYPNYRLKVILRNDNVDAEKIKEIIADDPKKEEFIKDILMSSQMNYRLFCILASIDEIPRNLVESLCRNKTDSLMLESLFDYCRKFQSKTEGLKYAEILSSNPNINEVTVKKILSYDYNCYDIINKNQTAKKYLEKSIEKFTIKNTYVTENGIFDKKDYSLVYDLNMIPLEYQTDAIDKINNHSNSSISNLIVFGNLDIKVQEMILDMNDPKLNVLLAKNTKIDKKILERLAYDNSEIVRGEVFQNIKRDEKISKIVKDMDCLTKFNFDIDSLVFLAETTTDSKIQEKIIDFNKKDLKVLSSLAKNKSITQYVQTQLLNIDHDINMILAQNGSITEDTQLGLSYSSTNVVEILASNKSITEKTQKKIITDNLNNATIIKNIIRNPSTTMASFIEIAKGGRCQYLLEIASLRREMSKEVIDRLLVSSVEIRIRLSENKALLTDDIIKILAKDSSAKVRKNIAKNVYVNFTKVENVLLYDKDVDVRIELAKNKSTSPRIREELINDKEEEVILAVIKHNILSLTDIHNLIKRNNVKLLKAMLEINFPLGMEAKKEEIQEKVNLLENKKAEKVENKEQNCKQFVTITNPIFSGLLNKYHGEINEVKNESNNEAKVESTETVSVSSTVPSKTFKSSILEEIDLSSVRVASRQITKMTLVAIPNKYRNSFFPKILTNVLVHGVLENIHSDNKKIEDIKSKISQEMKIEALSIVGGELLNIVKTGIIKILNNTKPNHIAESLYLSDGQKINTVTNTAIDTNSIIESILSKSNKE